MSSFRGFGKTVKRNCAAAVAWRAGEPLVMEEVEVSPPQPLEIRIKVVYTSLCRSDLSAWESQVLVSLLYSNLLLNLALYKSL